MLLTKDQIRKIFPRVPQDVLAKGIESILGSALEIGQINTVWRIACFLGQIAHESGDLRYWEELADGTAYEGRLDLGNVQHGDGPKYKGRGPLQITGRANYRRCGHALGVDLVAKPHLLATQEYGLHAAVWYWTTHNLNRWADEYNIRRITRAINGGYSHLYRRIKYTDRARVILGRTATLR